jgi:hypothetical protein
MTNDRLETIRLLIELSLPLESIAARVRIIDWDYDGETIELDRAHVANVLTRYLDGTLSAVDVERWANLLEGREDISFDARSSDWLDEVIFQLANPGMTAALDAELAAKLIAEAAR